MSGIRLVAFDLDGVLLDTSSSWVAVHRHFGTHSNTGMERYLSGEFDDHRFMQWDIALWKSAAGEVELSSINEILSGIRLMEGAAETVETLRERGVRTAIISAGIDLIAERVGEKLGIDEVYANGLETDKNGVLTGNGILRVPLLGKDIVLRSVMERDGLAENEVAVVGNSRFDCSMFLNDSINIAFRPEDEVIAKNAHYVIREGALLRILPYVLKDAGAATGEKTG